MSWESAEIGYMLGGRKILQMETKHGRHKTGKLLEVSCAIAIVCLAILVPTSCLGWQIPKYTHSYSYSDLLGYSCFNVNAEVTGTSTQGTILVSQSKPNALDIKIAANVVIAPDDWAGVRFVFPMGCYVQDILCTYIDSSDFPYNSFWTKFNPPDYGEYGGDISIGHRYPGEVTNGGTGTVIIDFIMPIDTESKITELKFGITAGARMSDGGYWILGEAYETIVVQLEYK